ncbi:carboxymuconolactone decarboxylase family protein [Paenalcaligenes niemegkensis]|uniref:carboxymuconolactone decarboxylase family protein n=1 Tax=Paenalcaligenes niemegkensis TaxID=2895469 RepID=UPI001EE95DF4|nr:carboxymuconolactone decarboxylase family protein [Paenalcaligenes niemegkensis]MCQ9616656.1 carboxymuconolactone decarboxylase family protein [Paenalcaligenes niemegkensis]
MTRLTLHTVDSAPESVQERLNTAVRGSGFLPNLLGILANAPVALQAYQDLSALNATASLSLAEREVVQLVAGTNNGCTFCVAGHTAIATKKAKLDPAIIAALRSKGIPDIADDRLQAIAVFTQTVINKHAKLDDGELNAFFEAGFTQQQALEVIVGVGLATICNFANNLAHTPLNEQLQEFAWEAQ